jgi:hypothetical protein
MTKQLSFVLVVGAILATPAQAMPRASLPAAQAGPVIPVGSGCGLGVRRGPFDRCDPADLYGGDYESGYRHGYYRGYRRGFYEGYHDAAYPYVRYKDHGDVVIVDAGRCGFGSYLSCAYGTCWRICY